MESERRRDAYEAPLLEDWLREVSGIDISRRLSPFIRAFPKAYRRKILALDYAPSARGFAEDYLTDNPTRNRPLDLHPLLVHIHGAELLSRMEEANLVKPRPTFHYRLPNCEIARPGWSPAADWNRWVMVERLSSDAALLRTLSVSYLEWLERPTVVYGMWVERLREILTLPT